MYESFRVKTVFYLGFIISMISIVVKGKSVISKIIENYRYHDRLIESRIVYKTLGFIFFESKLVFYQVLVY